MSIGSRTGLEAKRWTAALALCCAMAGVVSAADLGLITAGEQGTYYHFGQDLRRLLRPQGFNVIIHSSNGAADNVNALATRTDIQLAIIQSDIVAALTDQPPNVAMQTFADGMRLVLPLFDEEVHIVARSGLTDLKDLTGQRVAIGREGSGTYFTAIALFQIAGVTPAAMIAVDGREAIGQIRAGRIDAMVAVAGRPVRFLRDAVKASDKFALVPVTAAAIRDAYNTAEIPAGTYPWQSNTVPTVAVTALLVTYDPDGRHCEMIGRFARHAAAGLSWLVKNGHPYWKRVDFDKPVKGWRQYECASLHKERGRGTIRDSSALT